MHCAFAVVASTPHTLILSSASASYTAESVDVAVSVATSASMQSPLHHSPPPHYLQVHASVRPPSQQCHALIQDKQTLEPLRLFMGDTLNGSPVVRSQLYSVSGGLYEQAQLDVEPRAKTTSTPECDPVVSTGIDSWVWA